MQHHSFQLDMYDFYMAKGLNEDQILIIGIKHQHPTQPLYFMHCTPDCVDLMAERIFEFVDWGKGFVFMVCITHLIVLICHSYVQYEPEHLSIEFLTITNF